jgi:hypothetical protein
MLSTLLLSFEVREITLLIFQIDDKIVLMILVYVGIFTKSLLALTCLQL